MKKVNFILFIFATVIPFLLVHTNCSLAATTDSLYTQFDNNGNYIDGNRTPISYDKPVIRPSYVGSSILEDYIGPDGKFKGFWGEQPSGYTDSYYGHEYSYKKNLIIKNVGFYNGKSLALKIMFTKATASWNQKVTLVRDGGLNITPDSGGIEFQLVYNDEVFNTPVEGVYVELPVLSNPTATNGSYNTSSTTNVKSSNLVRLFYYEDTPRIITNDVTREKYKFSNTSAQSYSTDALTITHKFSQSSSESGYYRKEIKQTFIFDNEEPLVVAETRSLNIVNVTTLFKSTMKTPKEITYLPPRTNGSQNTTKFKANFDITQAVNDGYDQYYPDSLSLVMLDDQNMFKALQLSKNEFKDKDGKDISNYFEKSTINQHQLEFKINKSNLVKLASNQINITMSADNLDSSAVLKNYDKSKNIYTIPVKFYNYKIYQTKKTESEKMTATAQITPNIYGEPANDIKADQYTYSGDLDKNKLLKDVATTIPGDTLKTEIVDKTIYFDTVKTYSVAVKISSTTTTNTKTINVPVTIIKANPVTSAYFENQTWLINEINKQLAPKKIDKDVFPPDLLKITQIVLEPGGEGYKNQQIPRTIDALKNLTVLKLRGTNLSGGLPNELGNLTQLNTLQIYGNTFTGEIPTTITKLTLLKFLDFEKNGLTGRLPDGLKDLPELVQIYIGTNKLVGTLPEFKNIFTNFSMENTQLTYNAATIPTFMPNKDAQRKNTFLNSSSSLKLASVTNLPIEKNGTKIKPFDSANEGFFNLHARTINQSMIDLYSGHTFKIIHKKSGKVLYDGPVLQSVEIAVDSGEIYQVVMDNAEKNPNNVTEIEAKLREYKMNEVPKNLGLNLKIDDVSYQALQISSNDNLSIFDNRVNSQWQLKLKPSELKSQTRTLAGNYFYKSKNGEFVEIPVDGSFKNIESGKSEPSSGIINLSSGWNEQQGLFYKQAKTGNYKDSYSGKLEWQLLDVPIGS